MLYHFTTRKLFEMLKNINKKILYECQRDNSPQETK